MDLADYLSIKRAIQEDCRKKLEALELTWSVAKGIKPQPQLPGVEEPLATSVSSVEQQTVMQQPHQHDVSTLNGSTSGTKSFSLAGEVRKVIGEFEDETFTQGQVTAKVQKRNPTERVYPGSVSGTLGRLVKQGEIRLVRKARGGSEPSFYRRILRETE